MNKALNTLNAVLNQKSENNFAHQEDECDLYGRMLAKKLRKFPEHERVNVMYELDGTIIRLLSRNTSHRHVTTPSPLSAHSSYSEPIFSTKMNRLHSSPISYSEPTERYLFEDRPLSAPALSYYMSPSPTQQQLPQQQQSQHLPQQQPSQQHLSQQQPSQQLLSQQQPSQQHLSQQSDNYNTNMQHSVLLHIPDRLLSPDSSLESTQNNQNSITVLSDLLILSPSTGNTERNKII